MPSDIRERLVRGAPVLAEQDSGEVIVLRFLKPNHPEAGVVPQLTAVSFIVASTSVMN